MHWGESEVRLMILLSRREQVEDLRSEILSVDESPLVATPIPTTPEGLVPKVSMPPKTHGLPMVEVVAAKLGLVEPVHRIGLGWPIPDLPQITDLEPLVSTGASNCIMPMVERCAQGGKRSGITN